jgi:hypothetical protein
MNRLQETIEKYGRWQPIEDYIQRINTFKDSNFSIAIENSKSLLESIAKEICGERGQTFEEEDSPSKLIKLAFGALGVQASTIGPQIAIALSTIGRNIGQLRNEVGAILHGRTMEDLKSKKNIIDTFTREFLLNSTEIIACFLIEYFEWKSPRIKSLSSLEEKIEYGENVAFNEYWDDLFGEFEMGDYSFPASEILFNVDYQAYETEVNSYEESEE